MTKGAGLKQIIVSPAGVPGAVDSCYSALQTKTMDTATGNTVITDIGELLFMPTPANVSVQIQDPLTTWTPIMPASTVAAHQFFSDGANLRFHSADTSTTRSGTYYVVQ